ncbi:cation diffusion facilitator family transporter [Gudongella sp. DL1XJH-153]|uniref:cation diffusion facilitator family transporter n=1 Tax=Gudongella sp. DL1XJH-153 TaxID=3409804 RepID=UPI003BB7DFFE
MITNWLLNLTLKEDRDYQNPATRRKIGYLAGFVGVVVNLLLTIIKLVIGIMISSIGVVADGVNNMADSASSIVTLVGFKMSGMPADKEHPYGHGRVEYISALIVAFMVIIVGVQFIKSSVERILEPKAVQFDMVSLMILTVSILFKVWLGLFNKNLGHKISSQGLKATAADAMGDVLITSVVVLSIFFGQFTEFPVDGVVGVFVSLFIIYAGYNIVKDTVSPLIGEAPSDELIQSIYKDVMEYEYITGAHDLLIHSYGAGRTMATIDVEFPATIDVVTIHDVIDMAERELGEKYNMTLVIHMDPLGPESMERYELRKRVKRIIKSDDRVLSIHDFQVLEEKDDRIIEFHAVVTDDKLSADKEYLELKRELERSVDQDIEGFKCRIILDIDFNGERENDI